MSEDIEQVQVDADAVYMQALAMIDGLYAEEIKPIAEACKQGNLSNAAYFQATKEAWFKRIRAREIATRIYYDAIEAEAEKIIADRKAAATQETASDTDVDRFMELGRGQYCSAVTHDRPVWDEATAEEAMAINTIHSTSMVRG